jgi:hypothetical protein
VKTQDKAVGIILLAQSALGTLAILWLALQAGVPVLFLTIMLTLAVIGLAAGVGWLMQKRWGAYMAILFFVPQLVNVVTPYFRWSITIGLNFFISLGWFDTLELGINLYALAMLVWICMRVFSVGSR